MIRALILAPFLVLAACADEVDAPEPSAVTSGEAKALDEAAEMIEQRRLPDSPSPSDAPSDPPSAAATAE